MKIVPWPFCRHCEHHSTLIDAASPGIYINMHIHSQFNVLTTIHILRRRPVADSHIEPVGTEQNSKHIEHVS